MFNDNYTVSNCSGVVPALFLQGRFCRVNIMSNSCALLHHVHICTALFYWAKSCFTREAEGLLHCSRVHQRSTSWLKILLHKQSCCSNLRALKAFFFTFKRIIYSNFENLGIYCYLPDIPWELSLCLCFGGAVFSELNHVGYFHLPVD